MKTDSIFYELFLTLPQTLFQLINQPEELTENYTFRSQELKQLAKRIDGVFLPKNNSLPIYFVEVQFQQDEYLYSRLFAEIFVYLQQYQVTQDWQGVVFWQTRRLDKGVQIGYQALLRTGKLQIIYLDELDFTENKGIGIEIIKLIVAEEETAKKQVNQLFPLIEQQIQSETKKKDMIELLEKIIVYKFENYTREELNRMFTLTDFKKTKFYQETFEEGEKAVKTQSIPKMLKLGLTKEQIAEILDVNVSFVEQVIADNN